jgi:uncharacterized linocin/CFP29 family protein
MYAYRPDDGRVSCLTLCTTVDGESAGKTPTCWKEGVDGIKTRIKILERARREKIPLLKLQRSFKVRWEHFEEWARSLIPNDQIEETVFSLFTNHEWEDELTAQGERFDKLRRDIGIPHAENPV